MKSSYAPAEEAWNEKEEQTDPRKNVNECHMVSLEAEPTSRRTRDVLYAKGMRGFG
jgi:hypothetical protein